MVGGGVTTSGFVAMTSGRGVAVGSGCALRRGDCGGVAGRGGGANMLAAGGGAAAGGWAVGAKPALYCPRLSTVSHNGLLLPVFCDVGGVGLEAARVDE